MIYRIQAETSHEIIYHVFDDNGHFLRKEVKHLPTNETFTLEQYIIKHHQGFRAPDSPAEIDKRRQRFAVILTSSAASVVIIILILMMTLSK